MEKLIEKEKVKGPRMVLDGNEHPFMSMKTDELKTLELEDIHMRIARAGLEEEKDAAQELRKKFLRQ